MKALNLFCLLFLFAFACHTPGKNGRSKTDTINSPRSTATRIDCDTVKWYLKKEDKDRILVYDEDGYKGYYKKGELRRILKSYPELNESMSPDQAYNIRGKDGIAPCDVHLFGCEVCQDDYFILHAYFLKKQNGEAKYRTERSKLIELYRAINFIAGRLVQGGTYFGHQRNRILGYAEYSIYLKKSDTYSDTYTKRFSIAKQKKIYIDGLRQLIVDEVDSNLDIPLKEKPELKHELFETVTNIDRLITDYFYLTMTREFQYTHY